VKLAAHICVALLDERRTQHRLCERSETIHTEVPRRFCVRPLPFDLTDTRSQATVIQEVAGVKETEISSPASQNWKPILSSSCSQNID
jgi:hypothetical protein